MEKFIKKKDLCEVMVLIAAKAIAHVDKVRVEISIRQIIEPEVHIVVYGKNYERLVEQDYRLVPEGMDASDVAHETIMAALAILEDAEDQAECETPSNDK